MVSAMKNTDEGCRPRLPHTVALPPRGGTTEKLQGRWSPERCVIIEFTSLAQFKAWWTSPDYVRLRAIRQRTARSNMVVTKGF